MAETTILRPLKDRPLYCLVYGTRRPKGIEVFRSCQIKALGHQDRIRGITKLSDASAGKDQIEMFTSFSDMAPDRSVAFLAEESRLASLLLKSLVPLEPATAIWGELWPKVLERHVVTLTQLKQHAKDLKKAGALTFTDWAPKQQAPDDRNRVSRVLA